MKYDIVEISETWFKTGDDVAIGNLHSYSTSSRPSAKGGGGVGLLYKSSVSVNVQNYRTFQSFESLPAETRTLCLVVIYRPEKVKDSNGHLLSFKCPWRSFLP